MLFSIFLFFTFLHFSNQQTCSQEVDLIFILDTTSSVTAPEYSDTKDWILSIVNLTNIDTDKTSVGLIEFADTVNVHLNLNDDRTTVETAIETLPKIPSGISDTYKALNASYTMFDSYGGSLSQKWLILITDGISSNEAFDIIWANAQKNNLGVYIITVGVGGMVNVDHLSNYIASTSSWYFSPTDFESLDEIVLPISELLCLEIENINPNIFCAQIDNVTVTGYGFISDDDTGKCRLNGVDVVDAIIINTTKIICLTSQASTSPDVDITLEVSMNYPYSWDNSGLVVTTVDCSITCDGLVEIYGACGYTENRGKCISIDRCACLIEYEGYNCELNALPPDCNQPVDLIIIMDASGSIASGEWNQEKEFVIKVLNNTNIGTGLTRVAALRYGNSVQLITDFSDDRQVIYNAIESSTRGSGGTPYLHLGLNTSYTIFESQGRGSNVQKWVLVIADGVGVNEPLEIAWTGALENDFDVHITSFAITGFEASHFEDVIASNPNWFLQINEWDDINYGARIFSDLICVDIDNSNIVDICNNIENITITGTGFVSINNNVKCKVNGTIIDGILIDDRNITCPFYDTELNPGDYEVEISLNYPNIWVDNNLTFTLFNCTFDCFGKNNLEGACRYPTYGECVNNDICDCVNGFGGNECENRTCHYLNDFNCFDISCLSNYSCYGHGDCIEIDLCICDDHWDREDCFVHDLDLMCPNDTTVECDTIIECFNISATSILVCNGHGICTSLDTCSCITSWSGNECEIKLINTNVWMITSIILISIFILIMFIIGCFFLFFENKKN